MDNFGFTPRTENQSFPVSPLRKSISNTPFSWVMTRATPLEHKPHKTQLANGHSQVGAEGQGHAAIVAKTVRAFDSQ